MQPHEQRVIAERHELNEKIVKFTAFLYSEKSDTIEHQGKGLMLEQLAIMQCYSEILSQRIELFTKNEQ